MTRFERVVLVWTFVFGLLMMGGRAYAMDGKTDNTLLISAKKTLTGERPNDRFLSVIIKKKLDHARQRLLTRETFSLPLRCLRTGECLLSGRHPC